MNAQRREFARRHAQRGEWKLVASLATDALRDDACCVWALHLRGLALYQQGDHRAALVDLECATQLAPGDAEVLDHLGAAAAAAKDWPRAGECFDAALRLDPSSADAAYNLAKVRRQLKDDLAAVALFRRAAELRPTFWAAHANLANTLRDLGDWAAAEAAYRQALAMRPGVARTWNHFGVMYLRRQAYHEARAAFEKTLELKPDHGEALFNLGNVLRATGELDKAAECYRLAIHHDPDLPAEPPEPTGDNPLPPAAPPQRGDDAISPRAHAAEPTVSLDRRIARGQLELANQLRDHGRPSDAIPCYHEALRHAPDRVAVWNNLGSCLLSLRQFDEAVVCFEKALAIHPGQPHAVNNLAAVHVAAGRLEQGCELLEGVVAQTPGYAEAQSNLGAVLQDLGEYDRAAQHLERAVELAPAMPDARWNRGLLRLRRGEHAAGWPEYEWRWQRLEFCRGQFRVLPQSALSKPEFAHHSVARRTSIAPVWRGDALEGCTVFMFTEQGLGDAIQFVRFAEALRRRGARVVLETPNPLLPLFCGSGVADLVVPQSEAPAEHDYQIALMSLPAALGAADDTGVGMSQPYLSAAGDLSRQWRDRLADRPGLKVGIHWQGNPNYHLDARRSVPLSAFGPLSEIPGVRLINLQHGFGRDQLAVQQPPLPVEVYEDVDRQSGPFMDTAAILSQLDLLVTSDSALPHLAGALGVETWLVLPHVPDWRWGMAGERTPWYPSMRLFRQRSAGDWDEVFRRVGTALCERLRRG